MAFEPPRSLSPSKVSSFRECALAFRFATIEKLPDPPSIWAVKGTLVHKALERLYWLHPPGARTRDAAASELDTAWELLQGEPELEDLGLTDAERAVLQSEAAALVANDFAIEDPDQVDVVGVELKLEAQLGGVRLRGIIDRLDRTPEGDLVVVDYKTGRAPSPSYEQARLQGVHLYAVLCEEVLGERPVEVRLLHLREPTTISAAPTEQALRGHRHKTLAVWSAIERACRDEDFRPRTSRLCGFCNFKAFCPAYGGDPADAARTAAVALGGVA